MGRYYTLIIVLVLSSKLAMAQDTYTNHAIQKGESVYKISKQYGVTVASIFELNPGSEDVIYAGKTLRIPISNTTNTTSNNTVISDNRISNYEVKRGETKSGLSRRFGVSIAMLEQQNPQIVRMLQAGHIINIDKSIKEKAPTAKEGEHRVVKGETLWGIARKKGISVAQLIDANSNQLSEYLQIGQTLIIPDKNSVIANDGEYLVKRGDTKFELARRFKMTIAELEDKNPHIIEMLMAGHTLNVDNTVVTNNQVTLPNATGSEGTFTEVDTIISEEDYIDYTIQPKETLYSLSKKAGMTMEALMTLNPKLRIAVNKGDIIKMPSNLAQDPGNTEVTFDNTTNEIEINTSNRNASLFANLVSETANGLYFYTPFSSEELSSPEERQNFVNANPGNQQYIDFFQGAQIAIDSAKALNLNFDVSLIKKNIAKSKIEIESAHKKNALLVPFLDNASHYPIITSNEDISIIDIESNINTNEDNRIYKAIPSDEFQKIKTLKFLSLQSARVIVVSDLDEARNKDLIQSTLPDAKFLKVDKAGFFKPNELQNTLSTNKLNYIILDSEKTIVFLNSTTALMSKLSEYNIQLVLLESALIPKQSQVSDMRYRVLKLIFPSVIDPQNKKDINDFERNYEDIFSIKPSRHAILGFDITLDILLRLSQNTSFENTIETIISEHPHLRFDYKKSGDLNYSNTGLHLIQYNSNEGLIEVD